MKKLGTDKKNILLLKIVTMQNDKNTKYITYTAFMNK